MRGKRGFTLIELLVVISVIGLLATLVSANLNSARSRARDAQRKSDLRSVQTALRLYYNDKGLYPSSSGGGNILGCGAGGTNLCSWGSAWTVGTTTYMPALPREPLAGQSYFYAVGSDTDNYSLSACLENSSDANGQAISITGWTCTSGWVFQLTQ